MVRDGDVPVAVILPKGLGERLGRFDIAPAEVEVFTDPSDPIASQMLSGLLQKAVMTAPPLITIRRTEVGGQKRDNGLVAFYAAGIAVMVLANTALWALVQRLFATGYRLKA